MSRLERDLQRANMNFVNYDRFKNYCMIALEFAKGEYSTNDIEQLIQDVYVIYKEGMTDNPIQFIKDHFSMDVSRDSHPYWLSDRGLAILDLMISEPFPTF